MTQQDIKVFLDRLAKFFLGGPPCARDGGVAFSLVSHLLPQEIRKHRSH